MHVVRRSWKLQFHHCINLIGCGQGCSGMPKVFKNNEQLISPKTATFRRVELCLILPCSPTPMQPTFWCYFSWVWLFFLVVLFWEKAQKLTRRNRYDSWKFGSICSWPINLQNSRSVNIVKTILLKIDSSKGVFLWNFPKFSRAPILKRICERLLLLLATYY